MKKIIFSFLLPFFLLSFSPTFAGFVYTTHNTESYTADLNLIISDIDKYFTTGTQEFTNIQHSHTTDSGILVSNDNMGGFDAMNIRLTPGAYHETAAINFTAGAVVTFDGLDDPDAKFFIRTDGALGIGAGVSFILEGGIKATNIYFIPNGAVTIGANSVINGNFITRAGAIAVGASTMLTGRLFTTAGAIAVDSGTFSLSSMGVIDYHSLELFVFFTPVSAINVVGTPDAYHTHVAGSAFTCGPFNNWGFTPPYGSGPQDAGKPVNLSGNIYHCNGPTTSACASGFEGTSCDTPITVAPQPQNISGFFSSPVLVSSGSYNWSLTVTLSQSGHVDSIPDIQLWNAFKINTATTVGNTIVLSFSPTNAPLAVACGTYTVTIPASLIQGNDGVSTNQSQLTGSFTVTDCGHAPPSGSGSTGSGSTSSGYTGTGFVPRSGSGVYIGLTYTDNTGATYFDMNALFLIAIYLCGVLALFYSLFLIVKKILLGRKY